MPFGPVQVQYPSGVFTPLIQKVAGQGNTLLYNNDANNTVYLTHSVFGNSAALEEASPLTPGSSLVVDGTKDIYAYTATPGKTATVLRFPTASAFQPGVLNVSAGTVNVIPQTGSSVLEENGALIPAITSNQTQLLTIVQPAYEIFLDAFNAGGGAAAGALEVRVSWFEDNGGQEVDRQEWWFWPGNASGGNLITGHGPSEAGQLQIFFLNHSPLSGMAYQVNWKVFQRSHYYTRHDWRSTLLGVQNTPSGIGLPTDSEPASGLIGFNTVPGLGAGATNITLLPLYNGLIQLNANTGSNAADLTVTVANAANPVADNGIGGAFFVGKSDANGLFSQQIMLPRYECEIKLNNGNAAAKTVNYWAHSIEISG